MIIKQAEFIKSAVKPDQFPDSDFPELAFAGRSNVGKSSLINTILGRKKLVKTSSKPGCTQLINFFEVNQALSFVDLPGYGYAKISKKIRAQWGPMVKNYLSHRPTLTGVVLLVDIRRDPGKEEFEFLDWLDQNRIDAIIAATKADKLSKQKQTMRIAAIAKALEREKDGIVSFSSKSKQGREKLWQDITALLANRSSGDMI